MKSALITILLLGTAIAESPRLLAAQSSPTTVPQNPEKDKTVEAQASDPQPQLRTSDSQTVTARRVDEEAQEVPIPLSVLGADIIEKSGDFNVNRLKELLPTVQFYSTNPRNSAINIRGLGAPFGLTNDGI
jgi:iron complex outermembrane receptor protein